MKRWLAIFVVVVASACGGSSESPTAVTPTCTDRTASNFGSSGACFFSPPPVLASNFTISDAVIDCVRGLCFDMNAVLTNNGPGCAVGVQVLIRWYGADGAIPLPNTPDIIMSAPGGLSGYYFGARTQLVVTSVAPFNDVRSAHTVYRPIVNYTAVACR